MRNYQADEPSLNELSRYDILGSTLTSSTTSANRSISLSDLSSRELANTCLSCPPILLQVIRDVSRSTQGLSAPAMSMTQQKQLLHIVTTFEVTSWAASLQHIGSPIDLAKRIYIGNAYRAAVHIYVVRASPSDTEDLGPLVTEIIQNLEQIPTADEYFKAICWPTFVAGAETSHDHRRQWITDRFRDGLKTLPWAYLLNAIDVLNDIWAKKKEEGDATNWLSSLKASETDWLIA